MKALIVLIVFVALIIIGTSIGNAIGITSVIGMMLMNGSMAIIPQKMFMGVNQFTYLCIPFFILSADIMTDGGITAQILDLCDKLVGHITGGLAHVNVLASCFFAGITGSATADAVGLGSLEIEMMTEAGYDRDFSAGITAASAIIGPIIPPSNAMIIYATVAGTSVISMFIAGVVPGIMIAIALMVLNWRMAKKNNYPKSAKRATFKEIWSSFLRTLPALFMPIIIIGGILSGIFTSTESAAIAVLYSVCVTKFYYHTFSAKNFRKSLLNTAKTTCVVYFIIAIASAMGWSITIMQIPKIISDFITTYATNKFLFLLFVNIFLLFIGMLLDQSPAILLMAPVLAPLAARYGVNPIHFGIIVVVNLCIGLISPPIGMTLFVTSGVAKISLEKMYKAILPFFVAEMIALMFITYMPEVVMFLPHLFGY